MNFTIRYRQHTPIGTVALLVEDATGELHVCTRQGFRPYLHESNDPIRRAATLRMLGWVQVPAVAPYTREDLSLLLASTAA